MAEIPSNRAHKLLIFPRRDAKILPQTLRSPSLPIPIPKATLISQLTRLAENALRTGALAAKCKTPGDAKRLRQQFYSARKHLAERGGTASPLFEVEFGLEDSTLFIRPQGSALSELTFYTEGGEEFRLAPPKALSPEAEEQIFAIEIDLAQRFGPGDYHQQAKELYYSRNLPRD